MADPFIQQLFLSPWSGAPARGQLPQVPQRAALPTAVAELAGCLVRIPGGSGTADATYECQKQAAGTYAWVQIDGGSSGPLGVLGYAGVPGTQSGITTEVAITGLSVSATLSASRLIKCSLSADIVNDTTGGRAIARLKQNGTLIAAFAAIAVVATTDHDYFWAWVASLPAGAYTFTATIQGVTGSVSVSTSQLVVEDMGAA